ncbi:MAG: serine hydrolase, partial [Gemmatimonadota bacterium]
PAQAQEGGPGIDTAYAASRQRSTVASVDSIFAAYDRSDAPGCAVGVVVDGKLAYAKGYGMADLAHGLAITPASVFRTGSVSKQFTAAVIVLLAQDGVLSLDDRVQKWIPELPDYGPRFTVRRLLHHTSGVRDYLVLMDLAGKRQDDYYTDADVVAMLARQPTTNFEPGAEFLYSNSGYFLLSQIVKRATGRSMIDVAQEKMFGPLGMTHTQFYADHTRIVPNRAMGYAPAATEEETAEASNPREPTSIVDRRSSIPWRISMTTLPMIGDGGIFTTVEDLAKWNHNFDDPVVGGPSFVQTMLERGVLNDGDTIPYALGLGHGTQRGLRTVGHGGAFVGFRAATLRYPDQHTAVYTLCNRADANPVALSGEVGAALLADVMSPPAPERERAARPREQVDTLALPAAKLRQYVGDYHSDVLDATYRIRLHGDTLMLQVGNDLDGPLAAVGADTFRRGPLRMHFLRKDGFGFEVDAGRVRGIWFHRQGP